MELKDLLPKLTLAQAKEYLGRTDKIVWIEDNLCDPYDIPRRFAERIEERLLDLLWEDHQEERQSAYEESVRRNYAARGLANIY